MRVTELNYLPGLWDWNTRILYLESVIIVYRILNYNERVRALVSISRIRFRVVRHLANVE